MHPYVFSSSTYQITISRCIHVNTFRPGSLVVVHGFSSRWPYQRKCQINRVPPHPKEAHSGPRLNQQVAFTLPMKPLDRRCSSLSPASTRSHVPCNACHTLLKLGRVTRICIVTYVGPDTYRPPRAISPEAPINIKSHSQASARLYVFVFKDKAHKTSAR